MATSRTTSRTPAKPAATTTARAAKSVATKASAAAKTNVTKTAAASKSTGRNAAPKAPAAKKAAPVKTAAKPAAAKRAPAAPRAAAPKVPTLAELAAKVRRGHEDQMATVLVAPWEERAVLVAYGAQWNADVRQFVVFGEVREELRRYVAKPASWERWIEDEINGRVKPARAAAKLMTPRPHQQVAIDRIRDAARKGYRGAVEADSVGLGKTLAGLLGAAEVARVKGFTATTPAKVLILCPKSVIQHWRNTLAASGTDNLRVTVINYDQSLKLLSTPPEAARAKKQRTKNRNTSTKGTPTVRWDIVLADESHRLRNYEVSQRGKAFDRIARYAETAVQAPFVIWLSATVGQNPVDLGYMAPLLGQLMGKPKLTIKDWGAHLEAEGYAVTPQKVGWAWVKAKPQASAAEKARVGAIQQRDIDRLAGLLFKPGGPAIRRSPVDIAGWPEQQRIPMPVEFDADQLRLYKQLWLNFRQQMSLLLRGKNPAGALAQLLRFRQKASLLLIPAAVDHVEDLLENGLQVAVSCQFLETLDQMRSKLEAAGYVCAEFSGRNQAEREAERLRFQHGQAQVIFYTVTEGISLHAGEQLADGSRATSTPRANVIVDIRFSGFESLQIEGRTHRDGQNAVAYYMYGEGTVQKRLLRSLLQKMKNTSLLSGDVETESLNMVAELIEAG